MMAALKYPIGIQDFATIRHGDYAYADKTALIYRLISTGKSYFLSCPRRFGKSLLLSTIHTYFEGKRDLFCGLDIDSLSSPVPIIYQSGYLTIKDADLTSNSYTLGFPNLEARHGFMQCLLPYFIEKERVRQGD